MLNTLKHLHPAFETQPLVSMKSRQAPLIEHYTQNPKDAIVYDFACTDSKQHPANDPLHTKVFIDKQHQVEHTVSVHKKVGGQSDFATPGDLLCGSIAACLDSTIRVIANRFDIKLKYLQVAVAGKVDVRGTLRVDRKTPVGFTSFDVRVDIQAAGKIPSKWIDRLIEGAEKSCVVMQTLSKNCDINITRGYKS